MGEIAFHVSGCTVHNAHSKDVSKSVRYNHNKIQKNIFQNTHTHSHMHTHTWDWEHFWYMKMIAQAQRIELNVQSPNCSLYHGKNVIESQDRKLLCQATQSTTCKMFWLECIPCSYWHVWKHISGSQPKIFQTISASPTMVRWFVPRIRNVNWEMGSSITVKFKRIDTKVSIYRLKAIIKKYIYMQLQLHCRWLANSLYR